jgi:hypothetical protein
MVNRNTPTKAFCLLVALPLLVSACNFPGFAKQEDDKTANLHSTETAVEKTLDAMKATPTYTENAPETATANLPGETPPAAATTAAIPATTQAPPATIGPPTIQADVDTNCRMGPSKDYPRLGYLLVGQQSTVHGRNNDPGKPWWFIENPKKPGNYCWVWGETTRVQGDTSLLPIITPPPPPTPTPTDTPQLEVFFSNIHDCGGVATATFQVVNNSAIPIRSTVMALTDLDTSLTLYGPDINNSPFLTAANSCPPGTNTLPASNTGYISGPLGLVLAGHTIKADIQLCTEPGQGGECTPFSVQFVIP